MTHLRRAAAVLAALALVLVPSLPATAATGITADVDGWVAASETAPFSLSPSGTTGEDLIVSIELAEGTVTVDDSALALTLRSGSASLEDATAVTFSGSSADVVTALTERLTWTAPATPERSYLRLTASVGSYYEGLVIDEVGGHAYLLSDEALSWPDARDAASALTYNGLTGYLVTIADDAENDLVTAATGGVTHHIAATSEIAYVNPLLAPEDQYDDEGQLRGVYHWGAGPEAGDRITYLPWFDGEPNGTAFDRCVLTNWFSGDGRWNDSGCAVPYRYMVEFGGLGTETGPVVFDNLAAGPPADPAPGEPAPADPPPGADDESSAAPQDELAATGADVTAPAIAASLAVLLGAGMLILAGRMPARQRSARR